jgi:glutaconate CoA-transferase, subunit B
MNTYSNDELMAVEAARHLRDGAVCFVGIGLPSVAANLARLTHAPNLVLIYESGTIGTKPLVLPLSIGDGELAETADAVVSVPEIFAYWLQGGRIDVGFLGAAQIDRYGNLNTTVIGDYDAPRTRLPGAGGAPEIGSSAKEILIIMKQDTRTFVDALDFVTTQARPARVITNLGVFVPDPQTKVLTLVQLHPGVAVEDVRAATGWTLSVASEVTRTPEPPADVLAVLRDLQARTKAAHAGA